MAKDRGEDAFGVGAGQGEFVGVADAGGLDLDQDLALFRVVEVTCSGWPAAMATAARVRIWYSSL
jgi:hypothetical protein